MNNLVFPNMQPFRFWCQMALPTVLDDSLSYYEVLNKVVKNLNVINENMTDLAQSMVEPYDPEKPYVPGDYVWKDGKIYKCVNNNYGSWNLNDWMGDKVFTDFMATDFNNLKSEVRNQLIDYDVLINSMIYSVAKNYDPTHNYQAGDYISYVPDAEYYDEDETYSRGDFCVYGNYIFECDTSSTTGTFDPSAWKIAGVMYKCLEATTGSFDPSKWTSTIIIDEVFSYMTTMWAAFIADYQRTFGIVNSEGNSETDAMSQKATTESLNKKFALNYDNATTIPNSTYLTVNDLPAYGNFRINTVEDATSALAPISNPGRVICFTLASTNHKCQIYVASVSAGDRMYIRSKYSNNAWTDWVRILTTDLIQNEATENNPSPISSGAVFNVQETLNSAISNALKLNTGSAVTVPTEEYPTFDSITVPGNFRVTSASNATAVGAPVPNAGRLICLTTSGTSYLFQVYISNVNANFRVHMRSKYGSNEWRDWARVITTEIIDEYPTENSTRVVSSGGTYTAIQNALTQTEIPKTIPNVQPSSNGKINIPNYIYNTQEIKYHYNGPDNIRRGTTQGIASDGKRFLYFPVKRLGGDSGDSEIPYMCKWDAAKNVPALYSEAPMSYGHIEDICFVPYYVPGFDNGNVDRLYLTDLNRTTTTGRVFVIKADDLSYITYFDTYDENDDTKNLISTTLAPDWHGVHHIGYSPEAELFFVHCGRSLDNLRTQIMGVFDKNGTLIRGLNFNRSKGTLYGCDCDANYIYLSIYLATETDDVYDIYLSVFDWSLNPITTVQIEQANWEVEGICHIGNDFYISWIESGGSSARDIFISKSRYIKYSQFELNQQFPVNWLSTVFDTQNFSPFTPT